MPDHGSLYAVYTHCITQGQKWLVRPDSTGPVFQPNAQQMGGAWSARPGVAAPAAYTTAARGITRTCTVPRHVERSFPDTLESVEMVKLLRAATRKADALFRSPFQMAASYQAVVGKEELAVIMPTGQCLARSMGAKGEHGHSQSRGQLVP